MARLTLVCAILAGLLIPGFFVLNSSSAQQMKVTATRHVMLSLPPERELLGREMAADIDSCYEFMDRATNRRLPKTVWLTLDWNSSDSACNYRTGSVTIGLNQPEALADEKFFLKHSIARGLARLGLLNLSQGAQREDTEFLFEGMVEILVHEYDHSSRALDAAWATSRLLDEMQMLGLAQQRAWSGFSGGRRNHRNAAPGITFLQTFRELQDRDRPMKLFEALRGKSLLIGLEMAFKAPPAELEAIWLQRVREYELPAELSPKGGDAPRVRTVSIPKSVRPGTAMPLQFIIDDAVGHLLPENIFIKDLRTGRVHPVQLSGDKSEQSFAATLPIEANCPDGEYALQIIAINESGNLRRWSGHYRVAGP